MMRNTIARSTRATNALRRIALTLDTCSHANDDGRMTAEQLSANGSTKAFGN